MESTSLLAEMPTTTASPATPTTSPRPPPSPPPIGSLSEDANQKVDSNKSPSPLADDGIQKDEDNTSASGPAAKDNIKTNHNHESSIKLKRCKHGRIIIKDPLKKKSGQYSDNDANSTSNYKNGPHHNNNHIVSETSGREHKNGVEMKSKTTEGQLAPCIDGRKDAKSNHETKGPVQSQPLTPPIDQNEPQARDDESAKKISSINGTDKHAVTVDTTIKSRSSSLSLSPVRDANKIRSPPRRTRNGRSRSKKEPNVSRDRSRGDSHRRIDSPSPRRRSRSRSPKRRSRKSSRRSHKSSGRHRDLDSRRRSRSKSSSRHQSRSRSITPPRRDTHRRDYRADSDRRSKDRTRYDKHQPSGRYDRSRETNIEKTSQRRSPDDRNHRVDASDTLRTEPLPSVVRDHHDNNLTTSRRSAAQPGSKSSLAEVLNSHNKLQNHKHLAGASHEDDSSRGSPAARSPATPSIDDSSSSDTYDPEAPIIPISPGDSPPISPATDTSTGKPTLRTTKNEKGGDDDVPCSAVQMNQHEKYLQKLNRQERVIEEVKVALRPFYQCRSITKEQYKDVLRRAVPKICHSKNGEINPVKIRGLVDAYVKKMKRQ